ncbi:RNA-guided endonuclease TnpB family protein, partial [Salmonella enterica subsp. enterica serovar Newport]
ARCRPCRLPSPCPEMPPGGTLFRAFAGLKDLFVTDTGFRSGNPRHTAKYAARLAPLQRRLSKKG